MSSWKSSLRGTEMTRALLTAASKAYMVKVGGQSRMASPGSRQHRMSRSINSSAPQPTCKIRQLCACVYFWSRLRMQSFRVLNHELVHLLHVAWRCLTAGASGENIRQLMRLTDNNNNGFTRGRPATVTSQIPHCIMKPPYDNLIAIHCGIELKAPAEYMHGYNRQPDDREDLKTSQWVIEAMRF